MLNPNIVLAWENVEHDLYEENGCTFGVELDLFNGHQTYYVKSTNNDVTYYQDVGDDIYKAIEQFNKILAEST